MHPNPSKITICGLAGTGTTSVGNALAERLGLPFVSTGQMFRQLAADLGLSLIELEALATKDPSYDLALDQKMRDFGSSSSNFVLDGRLGWYNIPDSLKLLFICNDDTRYKRVAERDKVSLEKARMETEERERLMRERYERNYGIADLTRRGQFQICVRSDEPGDSPEKMADRLAIVIKEFGYKTSQA